MLVWMVGMLRPRGLSSFNNSGRLQENDRFLNTVENTLKSTATVLHRLREGKGGGAGMFHGVLILVLLFYVSFELYWSPVERHFLEYHEDLSRASKMPRGKISTGFHCVP